MPVFVDVFEGLLMSKFVPIVDLFCGYEVCFC